MNSMRRQGLQKMIDDFFLLDMYHEIAQEKKACRRFCFRRGNNIDIAHVIVENVCCWICVEYSGMRHIFCLLYEGEIDADSIFTYLQGVNKSLPCLDTKNVIKHVSERDLMLNHSNESSGCWHACCGIHYRQSATSIKAKAHRISGQLKEQKQPTVMSFRPNQWSKTRVWPKIPVRFEWWDQGHETFSYKRTQQIMTIIPI